MLIFVARALTFLLLAILSLAPVQCAFACSHQANATADAGPPCHEHSDSRSSGACSTHIELKAVNPDTHSQQVSLPPVNLFAASALILPVLRTFHPLTIATRHFTDSSPRLTVVLRI